MMKEGVVISKRAQFNFVWIFALVIGGAILFLAVYGALKTGDNQRYETDTKIAKSLSFLIDPLQAGFSEGSFGTINFKEETRINNFCFDEDLGSNKISVSTRSNIGEEWNIPGIETRIHNKYIFSSERDSGKTYYVFSKPFDFPYKISDLIFITSKKYCFINAPDEILGEISIVQNIFSEDCSDEDLINVCFDSGSDCDITVVGSCSSSECDSLYDSGLVSKTGSQLKYVGSLLYAAIYSSEDIYECNVNRLLHRTGKIAENFVLKADLMNSRNCNTNLQIAISSWGQSTINATVDNLFSLDPISISKRNEREVCGLWD